MGTFTRTGDPVRDADIFYSGLEREYRNHVRGHAYCCECGKQIIPDKCYAWDSYSPKETAFCEACKSEILKKVRTLNLPYLTEKLENDFYEMEIDTPTENYEPDYDIAFGF